MNVPELVKEPVTVNEEEGGAIRVALAEIVTLPVMAKIGLWVSAVAVDELVPLPKVRLFETVIVCELAVPSVWVTVAEGEDSRL